VLSNTTAATEAVLGLRLLCRLASFACHIASWVPFDASSLGLVTNNTGTILLYCTSCLS